MNQLKVKIKENFTRLKYHLLKKKIINFFKKQLSYFWNLKIVKLIIKLIYILFGLTEAEFIKITNPTGPKTKLDFLEILKNFNSDKKILIFFHKIKYIHTIFNFNFLQLLLYFIFFNNIFSLYMFKTQFFQKNQKTNFFKIKLNNINYLEGFYDFFKKFKITFFSLFCCFCLIYLLSYNHSISTQKIISFWFLVFMNIYWLLSTFIFFKKKYYWGKFTTANQRFWKRSLLLFWILEFFLFSIFLYLTCNANTESYYMLDQLQIYKFFLFSIRVFLLNLSIITFIILIYYFIFLTIKWQIFNKLVLFFLFITIILGFNLFFELYQFFHIINYYSNIYWEYDSDLEVWSLEFESRKTRTQHHYSILLGILKFWHIIFIVCVWFFFFYVQ